MPAAMWADQRWQIRLWPAPRSASLPLAARTSPHHPPLLQHTGQAGRLERRSATPPRHSCVCHRTTKLRWQAGQARRFQQLNCESAGPLSCAVPICLPFFRFCSRVLSTASEARWVPEVLTDLFAVACIPQVELAQIVQSADDREKIGVSDGFPSLQIYGAQRDVAAKETTPASPTVATARSRTPRNLPRCANASSVMPLRPINRIERSAVRPLRSASPAMRMSDLERSSSRRPRSSPNCATPSSGARVRQ